MISAVWAYTIAVSVLAASIGAMSVYERLRSARLRRWHAVGEPVALRIIMRTFTGDPMQSVRVRIPDMPRRRLSETMLNLYLSTCNVDRRAMSLLTQAYGAERIIGRLSPFTRGYRRAKRLLALACLPAGRRIPRCGWPAGWLHTSGRSIRFYTLMAEMTRTPALAEYLLESYPLRLSQTEIAQIVAMLHRGAMVLDYRHLLRSENRNMRMTGIAVVRHFAIDTACGMLLDVAVSDPDRAVSSEALLTLCDTGSEIAFVEVADRLRDMNGYECRRLCRCAVVNGYGTETLGELLGHGDREYVESLVESYKYIMA